MIISSKVLFDYIQEKFQENLDSIYSENNDEFSYKFRPTWHSRISYMREIQRSEPYVDIQDEYIPIHIVIDEEDLIQDQSIPLGIHQIPITMSFMFEEKYIDDFYNMMKNFIIKNKINKLNIGTESAMITISNGWDDDRMVVRGKKMYLADISIDVLVLSSALYSNDVEVKIDGVPLDLVSIQLNSDTEMVHSLKKRVNVQFFPNTIITQLGVLGYMDLKNPTVREMVDHIDSGQKFDVPIPITLTVFPEDPLHINEGGTRFTLLSKNMLLKTISLDIQRGSVVLMNMTFVLALEEGDW